MEPLESFDYKHCRVDIYPDLDSECGNPREYDNLGVMYCAHRNYELGDKVTRYSSFPELEVIHETLLELEARGYALSRLKRYLRWAIGTTVLLPLYLFDHSGLSMTTNASEFAVWDAQRWDWGQVGFIFDSARTRELTGVDPEQVSEQLVSEVAQYDAYLHGSVFGYTVTNIATGIEVGSCWGYLVVDEKDMEYLRSEARAAA
jgi:hypothetical protein